MPCKNILRALGVLLLGVALLAGLLTGIQYYKAHNASRLAQFHGTYLEKPRPVSDFHLMGIDEKPFTNDNLKGQWTLLFFGFTHCPSLCPTTMAELAKMYNLLLYKKCKKLPQVVMISVDPMRDKVANMSEYIRSFNTAFYGAIGDARVIDALSQELGVVYEKTNSLTGRGYTIGHSGVLMLINPEGELNAFFTTPHSASLLARDYLLLTS